MESYNNLLVQDKKYTTEQINSLTLNNVKKDTFPDRAFGAILGAMIGDACGSYAEQTVESLNEEFMNKCMKLPGGGVHKVGPGQVTDDSELMLCLM